MIELDDAFYEEIVEQARSELPNEACGVIAGKEGRAARRYPMRNVDESPLTYRFDAKEQYRVMSEIEDEGLELWAIYHTHTHTEAYPSPTDVERAGYPEWWYLIVTLKGEAPMLRAYRIVDGQIKEDSITLEAP